MSNNVLILEGFDLNLDQLDKVASNTLQVQISQASIQRIEDARKLVLDIASKDNAVYGINTGFGSLSQKRIPQDKLSQLQYNLIRSHCTGLGKFFNDYLTRSILLLRLNCLLQGHSGISLQLIETFVFFLNENILPRIPEKGSVGASGDLAPLAHLALALIGEGDVLWKDQILSSKEVFENFKKTPPVLGPKDGLALINGTAVMSAIMAHAVLECQNLAKLSDISAALSLEGLRGTRVAYSEKIGKLKPHKGLLQVCRNLNLILTPSEINQSHSDCDKVQDPYSFRCIPQVHGACRQTIDHAKDIIQIEMNSVTDNPLVFPETGDVLSGGNFHGQSLAFAMDYLSMGVSELGSLCERRIEKLINSEFSELPSFLTRDCGLNSGLMIAHVTVAALVSENKTLCFPASVDSIPTSTDKEDHVSMGVTAGLKLLAIIENFKNILSIELLCNTQAISLLRPLKTTKALEEVYQLVRQTVPEIKEDRVFSKDILEIRKLLDENKILSTMKKFIGELE